MKLFRVVVAFILITLSSLLTNCNNGQESQTASSADSTTPAENKMVFDRLIGTWKSDDGKSFERWTKNSEGTYQYVAFSLKGTDTSWNEHANIYTENGKWVFENLVKGQNDGKSVKFTSIILTENTVQFSNPAHDFPTDINYTVLDANTVKAFIVGPNNKGGRDTIPFGYTRFNLNLFKKN